MHLNIRSLTRNIENLSDYLLCPAHTFSIIGLSETWLNENSCLTQIPGYNLISQNRIGKSGAGVACYLDNKYHYKIRSDINYNDCDVNESLFIEIINPTRKNIIVGIVYIGLQTTIRKLLLLYIRILCHAFLKKIKHVISLVI
jgi:hypothetical protein